MNISRSVLSVLFVLVFCAALPVRALDEIAASAGRFRVSDNDHISEGGLEVRLAPHRFRWLPRRVAFVPAFGVMVNSDSSYGLYDRNGGFNLGGQVEFRSGLEATRQIGERARLGLIYYHLSNAGIYVHNPGSESLVLTFAYRL